jgi:Fe2+ or Zn2+ uptake regulation protein
MRITAGRRGLLQFILDNRSRRIRLREIHDELSDVDRTSIYRNLLAFERLGIVQGIKLPQRDKSYQYVLDRKIHHFYICKACGHARRGNRKLFERVGGSRALKVDVRVIAATHRDLAQMVRSGAFREDLWYRINVFVIRLPPLRERMADIASLAEHFAERAGHRFGARALHVTAADIALLQTYDWPGNVRELAAVIERAAILGEGKGLDIARALGVRRDDDPATAGSHFPSLDEAIRAHIERALRQCQGRIEGAHGAAKLLHVHPNTLRSRMNKLGVRWERFR